MTYAKQPRDWRCQECGRRMTLAQAERAAFRSGCTKCGSVDIDLDEPPLNRCCAVTADGAKP